MKILVKSKPAAKEEKVQRITQPELFLNDEKSNLPEYKVSVKEQPVNGQANKAIIKALAKYFDIPPSLITLVSGSTSKQKIFEIDP